MHRIILAFPKSGITWLSYCIETLTGEKVYPDEYKIKSRGNLIIKRHGLNECPRQCIGKIVLLIRNYKECVYRNVKRDYISNTVLPKKKSHRFNYMQNIVNYNNLECEKMLLYYEDLMNNPELHLRRLLEFLGELDEEKFKSFIDKYSYHFNHSISIYHEKSYTKGRSNIFHSLSLSKGDKIKWDNTIKEKHGEMFEKYLKRYEEEKDSSNDPCKIGE